MAPLSKLAEENLLKLSFSKILELKNVLNLARFFIIN